MADIKIKVEGRIATNLTPEVKLVTKNDGYTVEFEFDETWSVSSLKTALFIANGHCIPVPFVGNVCNVPMLVGVELLNVGVKSDDVLGLQTTTAAKVLCVLSADDLVVDEIPAPSQSVYDRIVEMINLGMVKGDKGDKGDKGEKGDAGAIKFVTVVALPTENIQEDAIYLVPIEGNPEENLYTEYVYVNGTWEQLGSISVQVDHSEYVKFTDIAQPDKAGVIMLSGSYAFGLTKSGTPTATPIDKDKYATSNTNIFISKGTLENIKYTYVKGGLVDSTEEWTDEDKAKACETLGAVKKSSKTIPSNGSEVLIFEESGVYNWRVCNNHPMNFGVPRYGNGGFLKTNMSSTPADNDCVNKGYVDNLPDKITLTAEQKAKWRAWLGIE